MPDRMRPEAEALLAHAGWVRALARSLVRDPDLADDLAQDAYVAALQRPPAELRNARGWLAQVLRNLARQRGRRQAVRERGAARRPPAGGAGDNVPSAAELVERAALHKQVVDAVLSLEEPCREAILLRFFEELPPRRIAQRLCVPVSTVHTRITRGLARLRQRMDGLHDGRRAWLAALTPLAGAAPGVPLAASLGVLFVNKSILALAGGALVAGLWFAWPSAPREASAPDGAAAAAGAGVPGTAGARAVPAAERRVVAAGDAAPLSPEPPEPAPAGWSVHGRVLDATGRPLPGIAVEFRPGPVPAGGGAGGTVRAEAGADGAFALRATGGEGQVRVAAEGWTTALAARVAPEAGPALVIAAPALQVGGRVVDERGAPVAGALVEAELPDGFRTRFGEVADRGFAPGWTAESAPSGGYRLPTVARVEGATLRATKTGYEAATVPLPAADDPAVELVLRRTAPGRDTLSGRVVDAGGAPVPGAWVGLGMAGTETDERGAFTIALEPGGPDDRILAVKRGHLPARLERPGASPDDWPASVTLQLGGPPLPLAGRVVDERGEPVPGAKVWVRDATVFGVLGRSVAAVEGLLCGAATRDDIERLLAREGADLRAVLDATPTVLWPWVRTDAEGRFRFEGLLDRPYTLRAMVEETLLMVDAEPVRAGRTDVEIALPQDACLSSVSGRVVSRSGVPVAGAKVMPMCDTQRLELAPDNGSTTHATAASTRTDEQGRFTLRRVPRELVYLRVDGEDMLPVEYGRGVAGGFVELAEGDVENLRIEVRLRVHLQVAVADPTRATGIRVEDAAGGLLPINVFVGTGRRTVHTLELDSGRTPVVVVPDDAATLLLVRGETVVERVPLALRPGEVNRVDL